MAYSDFTLKKVKTDFQLTLVEDKDIFSQIAEIDVSDNLAATLEHNVSLALAINTEKARSELIIINVLLEVRKFFNNQISLFSGIEFTVDKQRNLSGFCDFILSRSPEQLYLSAPVVTVVEAKNENIIGGLGQCIAEMLAAKLFNEQEGNDIAIIYGVVTSGVAWRFIKLQNNVIYIDLQEYLLVHIKKIVGIFVAMMKQII